jgi:hypothetical protein
VDYPVGDLVDSNNQTSILIPFDSNSITFIYAHAIINNFIWTVHHVCIKWYTTSN